MAFLGLVSLFFASMGCTNPASTTVPEKDAARAPTLDTAKAIPDMALAPDIGRIDTAPAKLDAGVVVDAQLTPDVFVFPPDLGRISCEPTYTSCTGLCGTVLDLCSGETFSCGGCGAGLACDVATHTCISPKVSCTELQAECGRIRNTCGTVLDCGACAVGRECDPDTNHCVPCTLPANTSAACKAMGIACGKAWLGCGPATALTECGACADGQVCNPSFNTCEPAPAKSGGACIARTKTQACADRGNQCGFVTDGCGGTVDCGGCVTGKECATGGVANRCTAIEPNTVCADQGRVCGSAADACGTKVDCGACPPTATCNGKGTCDPLCQPKKCADLPGVCGWKVPDGCGGSLNCYDCWQTNQVCGPLTDGVGECCSPPTALPTGWECGAVTNACGSKTFDCPQGQGCGPDHKCCRLPDKSALPSGAVCGKVTNSCGTMDIACPPGKECKSGQCCTLPTAPTDGTCGPVTNSCGTINVGCANGKECVNGKCKNTCWGQYGGQCGTKLSDGLGGTIDCPCSGTGNVCGATAAGATGTCSCPTLKTCANYTGRCGKLDGGCGGTVTCGCLGTFQTCGGGGTDGVCGCVKATCAGKCGIVDDKCGGTLNCGPC